MVSSEGGPGAGRDVVGSELTPPPGPARRVGAQERQPRSTMRGLFFCVWGALQRARGARRAAPREARGRVEARGERRGAHRTEYYGGTSGPATCAQIPPPWPRRALERARGAGQPFAPRVLPEWPRRCAYSAGLDYSLLPCHAEPLKRWRRRPRTSLGQVEGHARRGARREKRRRQKRAKTWTPWRF